MSRPRLIVCSGLRISAADPLCKGRQLVHLDTLDDEGNVNLHIENVTRVFERNMPDRVVDLLEIATYVFAADCGTRRQGKWMNDETEEPWGRDFRFAIPVRDLDFWEREDVQNALTAALRFMSSDVFAFAFRKLHGDRPLQRYLELGDLEESPFYGTERVVMFSGGLDSLAGAVEVAAAGQPVVAVSHRPVAHLGAVQTGLIRELEKRFAGPIRHIPVLVNKHRLDSEASQRTRAFLFSALGVAVASVLRAGGVRFYENGVTTLNWPVSQEVLQSRATRSTHPLTLRRLQEFYRLLTDRPEFAVDNPFVFDTKAEVVERIAAGGASELIGMSASCIYTRDQASGQRHCGLCRQCLDRRIAVLACGHGHHEREADYRSEVFTGPRDGDYKHNIAVAYTRQATDLDRMDVAAIGVRFDRELTTATRCYERQSEVAQRFIDLYKRHGATVCRVIDAQLRDHASDLRAGRIDRTSLLGMIGLREHLQETKTTESPATSTGVPGEAYLFRRRGEMWTLAYDGDPVSLKHRRALTHIHYLLKHPEKEFTAEELIDLSEGHLKVGGNSPDPSEAELTRAGIYFTERGSDQPVMDSKAAGEARRRLRELDGLVAEAERDNDKTALEWAKGERQRLVTSLAGALNKSRRTRKFSTEASRAKGTVERGLARALKTITRHHVSLGQHLQNTLRIREPFRYKPDRHVSWQTD